MIGTLGLYYLILYYGGDMDKVEGLLFSEAELEPLPYLPLLPWFRCPTAQRSRWFQT